MPRPRPLFRYFGSKWRLAPRYPAPSHSFIIEPFAGSAEYALLYNDYDVLLIDLDEHVVGTWDYLIAVSQDEIRSLPIDFTPDGYLIGFDRLTQEQQWLIGWWLSRASAEPRRKMSTSLRNNPNEGRKWSALIRERIATTIPLIRHWDVRLGSYETAPDVSATWFIDPPYINMGKHYNKSSSGIDYNALGQWCKSRKGQVMVCENEGATWLPFEPFADTYGQKHHSKEVLYQHRTITWF